MPALPLCVYFIATLCYLRLYLFQSESIGQFSGIPSPLCHQIRSKCKKANVCHIQDELWGQIIMFPVRQKIWQQVMKYALILVTSTSQHSI